MALDLSGLNGVRVSISSAILAAGTTVSLSAAVAPYLTAPDPGAEYYYLTLVDYTQRTEAWERVKVTAKVGADLTIERNISSSTGAAMDFAAGAFIQWTPGVEELEESGGGGGSGKIVLSCGGANTYLYHFLPESIAEGSPLYWSPDGNTARAVDGKTFLTEPVSRWYNNTGAALTISDFFIYSESYEAIDDVIIFTVMVDDVDSGIAVEFPITVATVSGSQRNSVNTVSVPDGSYVSIKFDSTDTFPNPSDFINITKMQLVLS
ncbi:MAG: hypothetical protein DRQ62_09200 [Gammaproteobacteria bacterium]|nr:MAG: hypothetical protein DRQ62_09200 [Gammaproteobacteria bacterium]